MKPEDASLHAGLGTGEERPFGSIRDVTARKTR